MPLILLAGHNVVWLRGIDQSLRQKSHETSIVENGNQALQILEHWEPDLVVTHAILQQMDGYEMVLEMKRRYPERKTKVLMVHGKPADDDYWINPELPIDRHLVNTHLTKPIKIKIIVDEIEKLLNI